MPLDEKTLEALREMGYVQERFTSVGARVQETSRWSCTHKDLLNKQFVILDIRDITTGYGDAILAHSIVDGQEQQVLIGSSVLCKQLREVWTGEPMIAHIVKAGRYYTFAAL